MHVYATISLVGTSLPVDKLRFPAIFPALKALDYRTWGILQAKSNAAGHPKMGSLKRTFWKLRAARVRRWLCEIAAFSGPTWRRPAKVALALAIISQASVLASHLKPFSWL
jgi:hypothetical protein